MIYVTTGVSRGDSSQTDSRTTEKKMADANSAHAAKHETVLTYRNTTQSETTHIDRQREI